MWWELQSFLFECSWEFSHHCSVIARLKFSVLWTLMTAVQRMHTWSSEERTFNWKLNWRFNWRLFSKKFKMTTRGQQNTQDSFICWSNTLLSGFRDVMKANERTNWSAWDVSHPSVPFSLVTQSCLTLCDPMDCSTPGLPVHHQLPELAQTHVHRIGGAILKHWYFS